MKFYSTRDPGPKSSLEEAIKQGLTRDGGLFVPEKFPNFSGLKSFKSWPELASTVLREFFSGDPLESQLKTACEKAFSFPVPLKPLTDELSVLELFHGPTAAFKDFGALFLANLLRSSRDKKTVLVATSGDTGGAVASAFHDDPQSEVIVLFPKGGVSARQEHQLCCWGDRVRSFCVEGSFDYCQRIVKEAFADKTWRNAKNLISANSINLGRLLPQMIYYAGTSINHFAKTSKKARFIVPTGNLGNAVACFWALKMGFPIEHVTLATNANEAIPRYYTSENYKALPTVTTLANAMDVGNPSNFERLKVVFPDFKSLKAHSSSISVPDELIKKTIQEVDRTLSYVCCPHTATAFAAQKVLGGEAVLVATAHPAKFETIVEPLIGRKVPLPESLSQIMKRPAKKTQIKASLAELAKQVLTT